MFRRAALAALVAVVLAGCGSSIAGTPTWPGAKLSRAVLTEADFPPGVHYERVDRSGGPGTDTGQAPPMLSTPEGCTDALTRDIAQGAEYGAGSAAEYIVAYDGARIFVTVLSWPLSLDRLAATAARCAEYQTFFDPSEQGIPMTTTKLSTPRADALVYEQTMHLAGEKNSVYFSFENVGSMAVFGIAFPTPQPEIEVKASLPQTFLDVVGKQADRLAEVA